ncbi:TrkA family potassium uptake protein [Solwaraspora sp. WMMA2056]|uniref:potassium channel family protein n=1 Tax=Solwaraspora sp. WMMA2056 TaxID=3015161 RepID=UPI00259B7F7D|nr:TrkA family potassium uptake protein [Solwaraspora sp. WMMA2056]WJK42149.1 TrkA family potassium uptake protein [Solwaraspora sp. WMMA2056]
MTDDPFLTAADPSPVGAAGDGVTDDDSVAVIGLGRFGGQVALSLCRLGHRVLGIDGDPRRVQRWSDRLPRTVEADPTDEESLRHLGVADYPCAVVGIGADIEASILTVVSLTEIGVPEIWAKAITAKHGRILASVGAHHVIFPEATMGDRVAHLLASRMLDFIEFDDGFAIAKVCAPADSAGQTLAQARLRQRYGITVVGIKERDQHLRYAVPDSVIPPDALLIVAGPTADVQRFGG